MSAAVLLALALALAPATDPSPGPAQAARRPAGGLGPCGDEPAKYRPKEAAARTYWAEHAQELAAAGDVGAKLRVFEGAWEKTGATCFLYFAYRANDAEGHYLRAYAQARQLEEMGPEVVPADALTSARAYAENMQRGDYSCGVELRLEGSQGAVEAKFRGLEPGGQLEPGEVVELGSQPVVRQFRVGTWEFSAGAGLEFAPSSAGTAAAQGQRVVVVDDCGSEAFRLEVRALRTSTPPPPVEGSGPRPPVGPAPGPSAPVIEPGGGGDMRRLSNVGIGVGAGAAVVGGVLLGVGTARWLSTCEDGAELYNQEKVEGTQVCRELLRDNTRLRSAGAGVLGAGIGLVVPAIVHRDSTRETRAIWLPIAGGVAAAAGVGMTVGGAVQFSGYYGSAVDPPFDKPSTVPLHSVGAAFTGLGAGLLTASIVRLTWRKRSQSSAQRAALELTPARLLGGGMLTLSGRF